jgi:hypothetical protein
MEVLKAIKNYFQIINKFCHDVCMASYSNVGGHETHNNKMKIQNRKQRGGKR